MGQTITQQQADAFLVQDLSETSAGVSAALGHVPAKQNQFDAFAAFSFNVGVPAFTGSTMLKRFLSGQDCTSEFLRWSLDNGKIVPGLALRRMAERMLFMARDWRVIV